MAKIFFDHHVPCFLDESRGLAALAQLARHSAMLREPPPAGAVSEPIPLAASEERFASEFDSHLALKGLGFPFPEQYLCRTPAQAIAAFQTLGGGGTRVAVKACSAKLPHKSEHGLVALNVSSEAKVAEIFQQQRDKVEAMGIAFDGIIIAKMVGAGHEFVLGAHSDPQFGPVVMLGDGGRYVEAMKDFVLLLPPFGPAQAVAALQRLRVAPLYKGVRGEPPLDMQALAELAAHLGDAILASAKSIASIDLNPVFVGAAGQGAWIADALIERAV